MNTGMFANLNEFDLSGINELKVPNISENVNNELLPSNLVIMNSNNQKLMNYQLLNTYRQLQQNQQGLTGYNVSTSISNPITNVVTSQQKIPASNEVIDNKQLENLIQNDRSKLAVVSTSEIKPDDSNINDSNTLYRNNNAVYTYYKNNIPFVANIDEVNQPVNYISNIDNLLLYNNISNIEGLNNIPLGGITEPVNPPESLLTEQVQYNSSKYVPMNPNGYYTATSSATPIQTVNAAQLPNPIYVNNDTKNSLLNPIPHSNEVLSVPPAVNTINKETKYIYKRRKRQTIDKTTGNIIQKKMKKKSKINQDLIHEKPGGLVSVNFMHNRSPCSLYDQNLVYASGFRGRRLRGKYSKTYDKNEYIPRKINVIDYPTNTVQQNLNEVNPSTIAATPINYAKVKKEVEPLNPSYLQLQLNNQVQNPDLFSSLIPNGSDIINNFSSINIKPEINAINSYFSLNDPKTVPKQIVTPQYIINKNDIRKEEKITNINSISNNALLEALTPIKFESSSSSSISSSPKSSSLTTSSITINNGFPLNNIITNATTNNTIPYINTKTDQIKFNNVYPLL